MKKDKKEKMLKVLKNIGKVTILVVFFALNPLMSQNIKYKRTEPSENMAIQPINLLK